MNQLRNNGIYSKEEYVGKSLEEATKYAEQGGFTIRIVEKEGVPLMLTHDVKGNRLNFRLKNNIVIDVFGGQKIITIFVKQMRQERFRYKSSKKLNKSWYI